MRPFATIFLLAALWLMPQTAMARIVEGAPSPGEITALDVCLQQRLEQHYYKAQQFYDARSPDAPAILKSALAMQGENLAFRVCTDADQNIHYFLRELKSDNSYGVCIVSEKEVFPGPKEGTFLEDNAWLDGWSIRVPSAWKAKYYLEDSAVTPVTFAQTKKGGCPRSGDPSYFHANNVPPGLLKELLRIIRTAATSETASAYTPTNFAVTAKYPKTLPSLHNAVLDSVSCGLRGCYATFRNKGVYLAFDVEPKGVVITEMGFNKPD